MRRCLDRHQQHPDRVRDVVHAVFLQAGVDAVAGGDPGGHPGAGAGDGRAIDGDRGRVSGTVLLKRRYHMDAKRSYTNVALSHGATTASYASQAIA